jgi:ATP-binding protein involved in chromosome partitioning
MITRDQILNALSHVQDPDLKRDLVSLGMIQNIEIQSNRVSFSLVLTTPACPMKQYLKDACLQAIREHISHEVETVIDVTSKVTMRRTVGDHEMSNLVKVKNIIAIVSGKGGVGKSTVAANLAVGLALEGASTGLIDGDIYGPSVPIMFGVKGELPGVFEENGRQIIEPLVAHGVKLISIGFFVPSEASLMWRGPMASNYLKQMISDTHWGELDYLIFDMPPGTGDMHLTLVQTVPVNGVVIVSTPQQVALEDARKAVSMFSDKNINVPVLGMVENMSWFTPAELPDKKYYLFGKEGTKKLAEETGVPLLGEIPVFEEICVSGDSGTPAVAQHNKKITDIYLNFCRKTAAAVSVRNAMSPPTNKVEIKS